MVSFCWVTLQSQVTPTSQGLQTTQPYLLLLCHIGPRLVAALLLGTGHVQSMGLLHFYVWTEGIITIGHAVLMEEGKDAELDFAMVLEAYEWNRPTVSTVTFCQPKRSHGRAKYQRGGKKSPDRKILQVTQSRVGKYNLQGEVKNGKKAGLCFSL